MTDTKEKEKEEEEKETTIFDLSWESLTNILLRLKVKDVVNFGKTCSNFLSLVKESDLWRMLLQRDYSSCDGLLGFDILMKQQNDLFLSNSKSIDFPDAPWEEYYRENFLVTSNVDPIWGARFIGKGMKARQCHTCVRLGDYLIVVKGFTSDRGVYALDTRQLLSKSEGGESQWVQCDVMGEGKGPEFLLYGHSCVAIDGNRLVIFGGMSYPGYEGATNDVWILNMFEEDSVTSSSPPKPSPSPPSSNSSSSSSSSSSSATASSSSRAPFQFMWEKVKVTGTTTPRGYHAAAVNNNKMYIYGGVAQRQNITDFCYLDLVTWEWHQIMSGGVNPPSARMGLSCTSYKDLLIFVGGTHGRSCQGGGEDLHDTHIFSTTTSEWLNHEIGIYNHPALGRRHGAVLVGSHLFCIGGSSPSCNSIAVLDIERNMWIQDLAVKGRPPSCRVSLTAHLANGAIFVVGGCTMAGLSREVFVLFPSKKCVPKNLAKCLDEKEGDCQPDNYEEDDISENFGYSSFNPFLGFYSSLVNRLSRNQGEFVIHFGGDVDDDDDEEEEEEGEEDSGPGGDVVFF